MKKQFYSNIIEVEELYISLNDLDLSDSERNHLKTIIETTIFNKVIDTVLLELPKGDKTVFLETVSQEDHVKTINFLKKRILNVEEKIKKIAKDLIAEMHEDVKNLL